MLSNSSLLTSFYHLLKAILLGVNLYLDCLLIHFAPARHSVIPVGLILYIVCIGSETNFSISSAEVFLW